MTLSHTAIKIKESNNQNGYHYRHPQGKIDIIKDKIRKNQSDYRTNISNSGI
jgi:hypothetical protein